MKKIQLLLTIIIFNPIISNAGLFGPSNFWECILDELSEAKNDATVYAGINKCKNDFPKESDRIVEKKPGFFFGPSTANECVLKYGKSVSSNLGAEGIVKACIALYPVNKTEQSKTDSEALSLPDNGYVIDYGHQEMVAPLKFVTKNDGNNYWIKVFDLTSNVVIKEIFIRSGHSYETSVPLGTYGIKYAAGKTWYGPQKLFGKETRYSKAEQQFSFSIKDNQYSGYTIELILQNNGNLRTRAISEKDW